MCPLCPKLTSYGFKTHSLSLIKLRDWHAGSSPKWRPNYFPLFFFNNVPEAIRIKWSLAFLIKSVNDVSFSFRYIAWQLQNLTQGFEDRHTVIGSRKKLTSLVAARNETCLATPLQHLLPATLRMKLLELLQLQVAPDWARKRKQF